MPFSSLDLFSSFSPSFLTIFTEKTTIFHGQSSAIPGFPLPIFFLLYGMSRICPVFF